MRFRAFSALLLTMVTTASVWAATASGPTPTPASLNFTYQINTSALPAAAKLAIALPTTAASSTVVNASICTQAVTQAGNCAANWLSVTPNSGRAPLSLTASVNPTGMAPGSYAATIYVWTVPDVGSVTIPVGLAITSPPSTLVVTPGPGVTNFTAANGTTPDALAFTYTTGSGWSALQSELDVATNGAIISFSVTVANATGSGTGKTTTPVWLRISPLGSSNAPGLTTSGVANSGSVAPFIISLDSTAVQSLLPGSYGGVVTFAADNPLNGTHTVNVNLVVSAGPPAVTSLFPLSVVQTPPVDSILTINGQNFFTTSVASIAAADVAVGGQCTQIGTPTALASTLLSQNVLQATIKKDNTFLAAPGALCICVTNPAPPTNPGQPPACAPVAPIDYTFHIISATQMGITSVVNAASYMASGKQMPPSPDPVAAGGSSIAPGELIAIFGQNLGPSSPVTAVPAPTPAAATSLPLAATFDTSWLGTSGFLLSFTVTNASGSPVAVQIDFQSDPNVGTAETLANIAAYINTVTGQLSALAYNVASVNPLGPNLVLSSANTGAASQITITDGPAAQLFGLTFGTGDVTVSGSAASTFPTMLGGIQVTLRYYDNNAGGWVTANAPLIMVSANQINAMVPFGVLNSIPNANPPNYASVTVLSSTGSASYGTLLVVNENPGIFTLGGLGTGQGAVLNCDSTATWTINGSKNPAPRGSAICIYATGLGSLVTPIPDTRPASATTDKVLDPVQVTIGGQPAVVAYAGTSYGSIGGLTQINAIVPPTVAVGSAISLTVTGGTLTTARQSQSGVTIAVK